MTGLTPQEQSKWWIVSGSLRGFYDDNSLNQVDELAEESLGYEFHPGVAINIPGERTLISASYDLTLNYYENRPSEKVDQSHIFDTRLNHRFSERYDVNVENSFIYSDEPAVLDQVAGGGGAVTTVQRRGDASGFRNRALIDFSGRTTRVFGTVAGYKNNLRDYTQTGFASYSALLDSVEHLFHLDAQWLRSEAQIYFAGYQYGLVNYTSSDPIGTGLDPRASSRDTNRVNIFPDSKNNRSHYFYVGARRAFSEKLTTAASVGVQHTDYYNANETIWSPYIDLRATYTYRPGSSVQGGVSVSRQPSDYGIGDDGELTLDVQAATFFSSLTHRFASRLTGTLYLSYQNTTYNGGVYDGDSSHYVTLDARLDYKLREYLFLDVGYVWTGYSTTIPDSDFTRNRVYFGIRATY